MVLERKEILNLTELSQFTGLSKSHIYKLTHKNIIPHYKPNGKLIFFKYSEILDWILSNRVSTQDEIESQASAYMLNSKSKAL